jgi:hypothetical protein
MVITPGTGTLHAASSPEAVCVLVRPAVPVARRPRIRARLARVWRSAQRVGHDAACPTGPPGFFAVGHDAVAAHEQSCPPGFFSRVI